MLRFDITRTQWRTTLHRLEPEAHWDAGYHETLQSSSASKTNRRSLFGFCDPDRTVHCLSYTAMPFIGFPCE